MSYLELSEGELDAVKAYSRICIPLCWLYWICGSSVVRAGCYNCPGWWYVFILWCYVYKDFCFIKLSVLLYVTRHVCEILFCLFFFFNPNNLILRHLRVGMWILWRYLVLIFRCWKVGSSQLVSELRLSEYLGNGGVNSLEIGLEMP